MRRVVLTVLMILSFFGCAFVAGSLLGGSKDLSPRWTISRPDVQAASCSTVHEQVSEPDGILMTTYSDAEINRYEADEIADKAFKKLWDSDRNLAYEDTELVLVTLPDDQERLVWSRLWVPDWQGEDAEILYIDADSGEILVHYTDFSVRNPGYSQGCTYNYNYDFEQGFRNPASMAIALFAVAIPVLLCSFILWRRYQSGAFV